MHKDPPAIQMASTDAWKALYANAPNSLAGKPAAIALFSFYKDLMHGVKSGVVPEAVLQVCPVCAEGQILCMCITPSATTLCVQCSPLPSHCRDPEFWIRPVVLFWL